jgi:hypothetical protein
MTLTGRSALQIAFVLTLAMGMCTRSSAQNPPSDNRAGIRTSPIEPEFVEQPIAPAPAEVETRQRPAGDAVGYQLKANQDAVRSIMQRHIAELQAIPGEQTINVAGDPTAMKLVIHVQTATTPTAATLKVLALALAVVWVLMTLTTPRQLSRH